MCFFRNLQQLMFPLIKRKRENNGGDAWPKFTFLCSFQRWDVKSLNPRIFVPIVPSFVVWQKQGAFFIFHFRLLFSQESKYSLRPSKKNSISYVSVCLKSTYPSKCDAKLPLILYCLEVFV